MRCRGGWQQWLSRMRIRVSGVGGARLELGDWAARAPGALLALALVLVATSAGATPADDRGSLPTGPGADAVVHVVGDSLAAALLDDDTGIAIRAAGLDRRWLLRLRDDSPRIHQRRVLRRLLHRILRDPLDVAELEIPVELLSKLERHFDRHGVTIQIAGGPDVSVPEPDTAGLMGIGLAMIAWSQRRRIRH